MESSALAECVLKNDELYKAEDYREMEKLANNLLLRWIAQQKSANLELAPILKLFKSIKNYIYNNVCTTTKPSNVKSEFVPVTKKFIDDNNEDSIICVFVNRVKYGRNIAITPEVLECTLQLSGFFCRKNDVLPLCRTVSGKNRAEISGVVYEQDVLLLPKKYMSNHIIHLRSAPAIVDYSDSSMVIDSPMKIHREKQKKVKMIKKEPTLKMYIFKQDGFTFSDTNFLESCNLKEIVTKKINLLLFACKYEIPTQYVTMSQFILDVIPMTDDEHIQRDRITDHFILWAIHEDSSLVNWFIQSELAIVTALINSETDPVEIFNIVLHNNIKPNEDKIKEFGISECIKRFIENSIHSCVSCYKARPTMTIALLTQFAVECKDYISSRIMEGKRFLGLPNQIK